MKIPSLLRLTALARAAAIVFAARGGNAEDNEEATSTFDVNVKLLSIGSEGGKLAVDYSIKGSKEGNTAEVSTDKDWIHLGKTYSTTFSFNVDKNETGEDRTGEIKMTCKGVQPLTLVVSQGKEGSSSQSLQQVQD